MKIEISKIDKILYLPSTPAKKKIRQLYKQMQKKEGRATLQRVLDQVIINHK